MHMNMRVVLRNIDQSTRALCKRCIPLQGQHKGQRDEINISFFMLQNICQWASCDEIALN